MKKIKGPKFFKLLAGALGITPTVCTLASCDLLQPETGFTTGYASPYNASSEITNQIKPLVNGMEPTTKVFINPISLAYGYVAQYWPSTETPSCTIDFETDALTACEAWGGAFGCAIGGFDPTGSTAISSFQMSDVTKIECLINSEATGTLTLEPEGYFEGKDSVTIELPCTNKRVIITHQFSLMDDTPVILNIRSEDIKPGDIVYIQDLRFLDSDGNYLDLYEND